MKIGIGSSVSVTRAGQCHLWSSRDLDEVPASTSSLDCTSMSMLASDLYPEVIPNFSIICHLVSLGLLKTSKFWFRVCACDSPSFNLSSSFPRMSYSAKRNQATCPRLELETLRQSLHTVTLTPHPQYVIFDATVDPSCGLCDPCHCP